MSGPLQRDVEAVGRIEAVPTILDVICRTTGMGFAAIARVTEDRWVACATLDHIGFGLRSGGELRVDTTICRDIHRSREPIVIDHVAEDAAYCGHPTPAMYGFQSYISVPIILRDGSFFGTLCAIDPRPARVNNTETIGMFRLFAALITTHLNAEAELGRAREELLQQRALSELREQFIAVLGHDLRNPVASVASGVRLLQRSVQDEAGRNILALMQSSIVRMGGLIDNLMDFARARLGGGLELEVSAERPLGPVLEHAVEELRAVHPGRAIEASIDIPGPVAVDQPRIAQLLSNLLGNALAHGTPGVPVRVGATARDGLFSLWVANGGAPIPQEARAGLFQPFFRGEGRPIAQGQGLGLGLYIVAEIARMHGGRMELASDETETRFTFLMPLPPAPRR
ncbi:Signal transduction histidine kinase [Roseomonas rosea]|uniref:histidine kinase n=1 Tax=Muricoccus roseus TaxID=198092 RepID=A0A1M6K4H5_9PROT|nr:GAF domain-containing sensor histidine kinase [Roseomonas rosea]SHJ53849.1 Signal transduction histidine kinase [Roseomonas rosea]